MRIIMGLSIYCNEKHNVKKWFSFKTQHKTLGSIRATRKNSNICFYFMICFNTAPLIYGLLFKFTFLCVALSNPTPAHCIFYIFCVIALAEGKSKQDWKTDGYAMLFVFSHLALHFDVVLLNQSYFMSWRNFSKYSNCPNAHMKLWSNKLLKNMCCMNHVPCSRTMMLEILKPWNTMFKIHSVHLRPLLHSCVHFNRYVHLIIVIAIDASFSNFSTYSVFD